MLYAKVKGLVKGALSVAGERNVLESFLGTVEQQISAQGVREESQGDVWGIPSDEAESAVRAAENESDQSESRSHIYCQTKHDFI